MIDTSGMSPILAFGLINRERDLFETGIKKDPVSSREIASFREKIGTIKTVEDLTADFEVFSFVMKAYGFEDLVYGKAMMQRILVTDPNEKSSLAARMNSGAFKEMTRELGFAADGSAPEKFAHSTWVDGMVERYVDQRLIDTQSDVSPAVGNALHFQSKAVGIKSWYDVLGDKRLSEFMRTALGLPEDIAAGDVDAQAELFARKMDITDLQDPAKVEKLIARYTAIRDALDAQSPENNLVTALFSSTTATGSWNAVTIDLGLIAGYSARQTR